MEGDDIVEIQDGSAKFEVQYVKELCQGMILAFSGSFQDGYPVDAKTGSVRQDWHLCDGTNGTPDLRDKFILGGNGVNNGATGGEKSHQLIEDELPYIDGAWNTSVVGNHASVGVEGHAYGTGWGNAKAHVVSTDANDGVSYGYGYKFGGNQPHNNMPPYYTLAYIMKL